MVPIQYDKSDFLIAAFLWFLFAVALIFSGILVTRACGTPWLFANFCLPPRTEADLLADRRQELLVERQLWSERLSRAQQCRPDEDQALLECQPAATDETLVLVDVSNSMGWDYNVPPGLGERLSQMEDRLASASGFLNQFAIRAEIEQLMDRIDTPARPDRIDVAQQALLPLAEGLREGARLKMMSFAECGVPIRQEGSYGAADATAYQSRVRRLGLRDSTALAEAIEQLPGQTKAGRGPDRPVNIVIISDGADSCQGDPCAAAARLRQRLPHAHVSVVSLALGYGVNACIAEATEGRFLTAADADELVLRLRQTAGQLSAQECNALDGRPSEANEPTE